MEDECGRDLDVVRRGYMQAKKVDRMIENYLKAIPKLTKKELKISMNDQRVLFVPPMAGDKI
jgi:hypothetical protein